MRQWAKRPRKNLGSQVMLREVPLLHSQLSQHASEGHFQHQLQTDLILFIFFKEVFPPMVFSVVVTGNLSIY